MGFQLADDGDGQTGGALAPVIFVMGPTAAGKTAVALELAARLPIELVSVDAAQVYRGMDIGTAKPSAAELARAPHRLIDIRDPEEAYSAADFCADALAAIREIHAAGRIPLLVGGTMFYFRSLEQGLPDLPAADPAVRARIADEAQGLGWGALHARLAARDADAGRRIHPNDPQRIQRALEILELTGHGPSYFRRAATARWAYRTCKIVIAPGARAELHDRIARRFETMLAAGFITEVERLLARPGLSAAAPSLRTVGYRQAGQYLSGELGYSEMTQQAIAATRQFAKRQYTWLRRETDAVWCDSTAAGVTDRVETHLIALLARDGYTF